MGRPAAEIVTGLRTQQPRDTQPIPSAEDTLRGHVQVASAPDLVEAGPDGMVLFVSDIHQYRLQLKALPDRMDMATGASIKGMTLTAMFHSGQFRTKDPEIIALLKASPAFGRDFWSASELATKSKIAAEDQIIQTLTQNPALLDRVMERMTRKEVRGDFPAMPPLDKKE